MLRCAELGFTPHGLDLEAEAVNFVGEQYGFEVHQHDFARPLPFESESFSLVLSRFALHYLRPAQARRMFAEVQRVLRANGKLLFLVNSDTHRQLGLQYDYSGAVELEPQVWRLPNDKNRTFLFYTLDYARALVGPGWYWHYLEDEAFEHWGGIEKRAVVGLVEKLAL